MSQAYLFPQGAIYSPIDDYITVLKQHPHRERFDKLYRLLNSPLIARFPLAERRLRYQIDQLSHIISPLPSLELLEQERRDFAAMGGRIEVETLPQLDAPDSIIVKLCWQTDEITLEDENGTEFDLGAFDVTIVVNSNGLKTAYARPVDESKAYRSHSDNPHPHIDSGENGSICLGEGEDDIISAVLSGRITLAALTVNQILETYNSDSPFCALEEWDTPTIECSDCGADRSEDEIMHCEHCGEPTCDDCRKGSYCAHCGGYCDACDEYVYEGDLRTCPCCERSYCDNH